MTLEEFETIVATAREDGSEHIVVPVPVRRSADLLTPVSAFLSIRQDEPFSFLLESVEGGEKLARYSFLGRNPYRVVSATENGASVEIDTRRVPGEAHRAEPTGDIFEVMADLMDRYDEVEVPGLPRLTGGAVGYMGYDTVRLIEHLPDAPPAELEVPDAIWAFYDTVVAFDHVRHQVVLIGHAFVDPDTDPADAYRRVKRKLQRLEQDLVSPPMSGAPVSLTGTA